MATVIKISPLQARQFMRRALLLDTPAPDTATALSYHGYVQIDPINVCGRMHDLILRNRVAGYREGDLHRLIHSAPRAGYEHYLPGTPNILVAYPIASWPMLASRIRSRKLRRGTYGRALAPTYEKLATRILREIAERGPLTSDDIEHAGRSRTGWGTPGRLVKNVLEVLFSHGRVLIAARRNFRRVYDLPANVLPPAALNTKDPSPTETARWLALTPLRQRRLVQLKKKDLSLIEDLVQPVRLDGGPLFHCLREDLSLFDLPTPSSPLPASSLLLAPLDPIIYDRRVTSALWDYHYTWEVYTPPSKRQRGYYALPILAGTELVGHVDPKADREKRKLRVISRRIRRGYKIAPALDELAGWLGLRR
jgi:uncharacterized protein